MDQWIVACVLLALGQMLNGAIYTAIGKDGVYYGFKLGRPVEWCTGFPFNLGFRHPQYVGGLLSQLGVLVPLTTDETLSQGLSLLVVFWVGLCELPSPSHNPRPLPSVRGWRVRTRTHAHVT